jgi:hypothetical protein
LLRTKGLLLLGFTSSTARPQLADEALLFFMCLVLLYENTGRVLALHMVWSQPLVLDEPSSQTSQSKERLTPFYSPKKPAWLVCPFHRRIPGSFSSLCGVKPRMPPFPPPAHLRPSVPVPTRKEAVGLRLLLGRGVGHIDKARWGGSFVSALVAEGLLTALL